MNSYIKNTNEDEFSDIKSLHVTLIMPAVICKRVYELLMSILT